MKKIEIQIKNQGSGKQSIMLIVNDKQVEESRPLHSDTEVDYLLKNIVSKVKKELYRF